MTIRARGEIASKAGMATYRAIEDLERRLLTQEYSISRFVQNGEIVDSLGTLGTGITLVDLEPLSVGALNSFARSDHHHKLDESIEPHWSGHHVWIGASPQIEIEPSTIGVESKILIQATDATATLSIEDQSSVPSASGSAILRLLVSQASRNAGIQAQTATNGWRLYCPGPSDNTQDFLVAALTSGTERQVGRYHRTAGKWQFTGGPSGGYSLPSPSAPAAAGLVHFQTQADAIPGITIDGSVDRTAMQVLWSTTQRATIEANFSGGQLVLMNSSSATSLFLQGNTHAIAMKEAPSDATTIANFGSIYTKDISTITELFYRDSAGTVTQLTSNGSIGGGSLSLGTSGLIISNEVDGGGQSGFEMRLTQTRVTDDAFQISNTGDLIRYAQCSGRGEWGFGKQSSASSIYQSGWVLSFIANTSTFATSRGGIWGYLESTTGSPANLIGVRGTAVLASGGPIPSRAFAGLMADLGLSQDTTGFSALDAAAVLPLLTFGNTPPANTIHIPNAANAIKGDWRRVACYYAPYAQTASGVTNKPSIGTGIFAIIPQFSATEKYAIETSAMKQAGAPPNTTTAACMKVAFPTRSINLAHFFFANDGGDANLTFSSLGGMAAGAGGPANTQAAGFYCDSGASNEGGTYEWFTKNVNAVSTGKWYKHLTDSDRTQASKWTWTPRQIFNGGIDLGADGTIEFDAGSVVLSDNATDQFMTFAGAIDLEIVLGGAATAELRLRDTNDASRLRLIPDSGSGHPQIIATAGNLILNATAGNVKCSTQVFEGPDGSAVWEMKSNATGANGSFLMTQVNNATSYHTRWKDYLGNVIMELIGNGTIGVLTFIQDSIIRPAGNGLKIADNVAQKQALWNKTPIVQPAGALQAAITNSTGGTQDGTLVDVTTAGVADPAKVNDNFTDIYALLNAMRTAMVDFGSMKGAA